MALVLALQALALLRSPLLHPPPPHPSRCTVALSEPDLQTLVQRDRLVRKAGLALGGACLGGAVVVGLGSGTLNAGQVLPPLALVAALAAANEAYANVANDESGAPLDEAAHFEVREAPGKGSGLFATRAIDEGAYLFAYGGERLTEDQFFARYPKADGRYIACINDELYIDGADADKSNVARWMNHAAPDAANVAWRKQRKGPRQAMHFYAIKPVRVGDELCFDYGEEYWAALGEAPV